MVSSMSAYAQAGVKVSANTVPGQVIGYLAVLA